MCPKSAVKHFHFCRSLRFYHLSSELPFVLAVCLHLLYVLLPVVPSSPPDSPSAVRVFEFPVWTDSIAIALSLFEVGTYSYAIVESV